MAIENLEQRIGYKEKDGARKMPRFNVTGHDYTYPGSWSPLDADRFVVLSPGFKDWALIASIKAQLNIPTKAELEAQEVTEKPVSKKAKADNGE